MATAYDRRCDDASIPERRAVTCFEGVNEGMSDHVTAVFTPTDRDHDGPGARSPHNWLIIIEIEERVPFTSLFFIRNSNEVRVSLVEVCLS